MTESTWHGAGQLATAQVITLGDRSDAIRQHSGCDAGTIWESDHPNDAWGHREQRP
jgi:hypothetical protein